MNQDYSLFGILSILFKWKIKIIYATIMVMIVAAIVSLLLPNYYKANTVFYAASPELADPLPIGGLSSDKSIYGSDKDLDRLFSIANSSQITELLIDEFKLYDHYKIDSTSSNASLKVRKKLSKLMNTVKTKHSAIELSVEDKDPEFAAMMANAARDKINQRAQDVIKLSQRKTIHSYEQSIQNKETLSKILADSLSALKKKYNIVDARTQGESYSEIYTATTTSLIENRAKYERLISTNAKRDSIIKYQIVAEALEKKLEGLQSDLEIFNVGSSEIRKLEQEYLRLIDQVSLDKERLKQLMASYNAQFTALHIVDEADKPDEKSRPKRSLIVLAAGFLAFVFSILGVILIETSNLEEWKKAWNAA
jgi:tyrosine-protein kinase Etk/Wzc